MPEKLSIITINKNNAEGLRKTIESVLNQEFTEFEYLIVDGASTDNSVDVIREYQSGITWWVSEKDSGIYHAMNKGINKAQGKYCHFLNSGDWLVDNHVVKRMLSAIPDCDIFVGKKIAIDAKGKIHYEKHPDRLGMFTFYRSTIQHTSAYIRRKLFEQYGLYDEKLKVVSDWKWYLQVAGFHKVSVYFTNIYVTYFDSKGISSSNLELLKSERRKVLEELLPAPILKDYDNYYWDLIRMDRIRKYRLIFFLFRLTERVLFKFEKWCRAGKKKTLNDQVYKLS